MDLGQKLYGFEVTRVQPMPKDGEVFYELRHIKSGAKLAWMKNSEENKLFSIAFKTIPSDDTGVFHILEHTVLNGSKKYPVKEPFVELLKSSMQTFLNAMTFPDKTVFPVSSRNDTDFLNLTKVYLDAVFQPAIYENPYIFQQEGWHYELRSENESPVYKGVVFNEMKGAMSSVFAVNEREMNRLLFPDNCYRFVSGGDPISIPDLTYENYLNNHRKFYSPSNAYIYLDGPVNAQAVLKLLDEEYLSVNKESEDAFEIPMQVAIEPVEAVRYYEISPEEPMENRTYLSLGKVIATWQEREKQFAASVLCETLVGSNDAPLKRALLNTGLCWDVSMNIVDGIAQPYMMLCVQNTDYEHKDSLCAVIHDTVKEIISKGIDREALCATIDNLELRFREGFEPKGLERNLSALSVWLYGGDPLTYIGFENVFAFLREMLSTDYYEKLLHEMLIDKAGQATLHMLPSQTLGQEQRSAEAKRLHSIKENWSAVQLQKILRDNERLDEWQYSENTPEQLAKLPRLELSEVSLKPERIITHEIMQDGIRVLYHPSRAKGIAYLNFYFSIGDCTKEDLSKMAVMTNLLGQLPTRNYTSEALQQKIRSLFGNFAFSVEAFSRDTESCKPWFAIKTSFLEQNLSDALALLAEILTETDFKQPDSIREILLQCQDNFRQSIIEDGHLFAIRRALARFSAENTVKELTFGFDAYECLKDLIKRYDENIDCLVKDWTAICSRIFCTERLTIGMTSEQMLPLTALQSCLEKGEECEENFSCRFNADYNEGIAIPAGVSYTATGLNINKSELDISAMRVISTIMSFDYLWNNIRVKGGAYGAGMSVGYNGNIFLYSYRDPSVTNSLNIYRKANEYLKHFCESGERIDNYIISTIAGQEPLRTDSERGVLADELFFRGVTYENLRGERQRMLSLRSEDLAACCNLLERIADGAICVIGNEDALTACEKENLSIKTI